MTASPVKRARRVINGIVLLDKPTGMSSNDALQKVKWMFRAKKAGHTGSLDPLATGMLPICFGEATKLCQYLLEQDKTYVVTAQLGVRTTTSDSEGEVVSERTVSDLTLADIEQALVRFRGALKQVPSMYSALKHQGQPLYKLARQGITVDRPARDITVYQNKLVSWDVHTHQLCLEITCSKGTYIRTIVDDLGELLGCGAHVVALRRLNVAGFDQSEMISLDQLHDQFNPDEVDCLDDYCLPVSCALKDWPTLVLDDEAISDIRHGRYVQYMHKDIPSGSVRVVDNDHILTAIAELSDDMQVKSKRLFHL